MIDKIKPYPQYKEPGVPWLDAVPCNWKVVRIKTVLRELDRRSPNGEGTLLSLTRLRGLIPQTEASERMHGAKTLVGYKLYRPGEIVMNRMQAWSGMFGACSLPGLVSPDYAVFQIVGAHNVGFVVQRLRAPDLVGQFRLASRGIGSGFNRLYTDRFGPILITLPPPDDQSAIVRFLNYANLKLERAIRANKKLIALLNEQKRAIIQQAVTRGLEPNVRFKSSGIPWLGDIPEHWSISRLKFETSDIVDCLHATPKYREDGQFPAIRTADIELGKVRIEAVRRVSGDQYALWTSRLAPQEGDILYSREGERYGIAALVPAGVQLCISQRMMVFRIRPPQRSSFLMWQLNCQHVYSQAAADTIGATSPHVNVERIKNFLLVLPPPQEQDEISTWISAHTMSLDAAIARAHREVDLLREYRASLIADVVTGRLDVREAAERLPGRMEEVDVTEEPPAEDEAEELLEAVAEDE